MIRQRKAKTRPEKKPPYDEAFAAIDVLEEKVVDQMVTCNFGVMDVIKWLYPDDVVDLLVRAATCTVNIYGHQQTEGFVIPDGGPYCRFNIEWAAIGMLPPRIDPHPSTRGPYRDIESVLKEIDRIHAEFDVVRDVVGWCNMYGRTQAITPAAVRNYFPAMCSLLPSDHAVNRAAGITYTEPNCDMSSIMHKMREGQGIVGAALFCHERKISRHNHLILELVEPGPPGAVSIAISQRFVLL